MIKKKEDLPIRGDEFNSFPEGQDKVKQFQQMELSIAEPEHQNSKLPGLMKKSNTDNDVRRSEDLWQFAIEATNDGIWDWNVVTGEVFFSARWTEMLGYKANEFEGRFEEWKDRVHPDDIGPAMDGLEKHLSGKKPNYLSEHRMRCKDGTYKWIIARGKLIEWTKEGKPARVIGTHTDISEYKTAVDEILWRTEDLQLMNAVNQAANNNQDLGSIINLIADQLKKIFNSNLLSIHLPDNDRGEFVMIGNALNSNLVRKIEKLIGKELPQIRLRINSDHPFSEIERTRKGLLILGKKEVTNRMAGFLKGTGWPVVVQKLIKEMLPAICNILEYRSSIAVPLISKGKIIGFLELGSRNIMTVNDLNRIQSIADHLASVISRYESEEKLRESEVQYRNLANAGSALIWTSGKNKQCNYFNDTWLRFTGRSIEQEMGLGWEDGVHPDDLVSSTAVYHAAFDKREAFEVEYRLRHSSGEYRWILDMGIPNFNSEGEFVGYIGHCFDISDRKQTLFALNESEKKYRSIFESVQEVYFEASLDGIMLEVSPSIEKVTRGQFTRNEILGESFVGIYENPGDRDRYLSKLLRYNRVNDYELSLKNKNGSIIPVAVSSVLLNDKDGKPEKITGILRDITDRKNAENSLKEMLDQLNQANLNLEIRVEERTKELLRISGLQQAILTNAPIGILITSENGKFQSLNPAGEKMLGYKSEEIIDRYTPLFFFDRDEVLCFCSERSGLSNPGESEIPDILLKYMYHRTSDWTWVRKNGDRFPVRITHSSILDDNGELQGYMSLISDITQEKLAIDTLLESEERFHRMFMEHSAVMMLVDPESGEIIDANRAAQQFYGFPFDSFPRLQISSINVLSPDEIKHVIGEAISKNQNFFVFPHKLASGEIRMVEVHSTPIQVRGVKVLFSIIHDITERITAENSLRMSEAENRAIIQAVPDLMFRIHRDGTYLDLLTQNDSPLYVPRDLFIGKKINEILPPDLASQSMLAIENAFISGRAEQYEYTLAVQLKDRHFENRIIAISDNEVLSIIRDISDKKMAVHELHTALQNLGTLIQNLQAGTLFENENRHITYVNQSFCTIFNIPAAPEQLIGYDCVVASHDSKHLMKDQESFIARIDEILTSGVIVTNDELFLNDGRVLERDYIPIRNKETILGHLWQYRDISERKLVERYNRIEKEYAIGLSAISNLDETLKLTLDTMMKIEGIDCGGIYLFNNGFKTPELRAHHGLSERFMALMSDNKPSSKLVELIISGKAHYGSCDSVFQQSCSSDDFDHIKGLALIPLQHKNKVAGVINLGSHSMNEFSVKAVSMIETLALQAGVAISRISAENALLASKQNFQLLFDSLEEFMFILDDQGNIMVTNPVFQNRLGYTAAELENMHVLSVHPPEMREKAGFIVGEMLAGRETHCPVPLFTKDGNYIQVETRIVSGKWNGKDVLYGISRDMTEHYKAEAALHMQSAAFESFALAIIITDVKGRIQWANSGFSRLTGYTIEESLGKIPGELVHSGKQDKEFYRNFWNTILGKKVWTGEMINRRKDGTLFYEEETITPVIDHLGNISSFIAIKIDVSERKAMEEALRESEARWNFALEGSGDGVWDWNVVTGELFLSRQWKNMLGYSAEEVGNTLDEWDKRVHPDDKPQCYIELEKHFSGETEVYQFEYRILSKSGLFIWIYDRGKVVDWVSPGKPGRVIGTITDTSKRKELEANLIASIEKEKELNDLKSRFVSMASHEFRTPLASILMTSETLTNYWKKLDEIQIWQKLGNIKSQVLHLNSIVANVMQVSKMQEGKIGYQPAEMDIVALCLHAIDEINQSEHLEGVIEFSSDFRDLKMILDERLMLQVLNNLLSNAVKYSQPYPKVQVRLFPEADSVILSVKDNGIGIPRKDQNHLFEPFFRAGNTKDYQGNGLGLSIVKESVNLLGGDVGLLNVSGKGSTFVVRLPQRLIVKE